MGPSREQAAEIAENNRDKIIFFLVAANVHAGPEQMFLC